jgi:hypothetical protein
MQRRIESGETQVKFALLGGRPNQPRNDLKKGIQQKAITMSVSDGLDLFELTLKRLGLE